MKDKDLKECLALLASLQKSVLAECEDSQQKWMTLMKIDEIKAFLLTQNSK